jgi:RND family efflux transporter MFP subunit
MNQTFKYFQVILIVPILLLALVACGGSSDVEDSGAALQSAAKAVPVQLVEAGKKDVLVELYSVGRLVSRNTPSLAAEIDARVVEVLVEEGEAVEEGQVLILLDTTKTDLAKREAEAEIQRLKASIANEQRRVDRYRDLKTKDVMPQERLDDAEAQLAVYQASLLAADVHLAIAEDRLSKARLLSPVDGVVETRHVSVGDFVKNGNHMVTVTDTQSMRALLPFPETVGYQLKVGQTLLLESPINPGHVLEATVNQIRPQVGSMNRSLMVIADLENPGYWRPEATVEASIVVERRPDAVVVPSRSVVSRPAGEVVYILDSAVARQQIVETGVKGDGWIEIRTGLQAGDEIVKEGAHYLSEGAPVVVQDPLQ